jgi:1-phosphofructokinase family hexose kinase
MFVLSVTPNVAIDRTLEVPGFVSGGVWRAQSVRATCGGKGINVARAVVGLGHRAACAGLLAGHTGRLAAATARDEGLEGAWTWIPGESRTCVIILGGDDATTVINEPGTLIAPLDWVRLEQDVAAAAARADVVCISGSLPPGAPPGGLTRLVTAARGSGRPVWVDTSGAALKEAVHAAPVAIKVNVGEAEEMLQYAVPTTDYAAQAALELSRRCAAAVAITLSGEGAVLATDGRVWTAWPPRVRVVSPVSSGDCFLAGLVLGMAEESDPGAALRRGVAAGTASVLSAKAGEIDPERYAELVAKIRVEPIKL